MGMVIGTKRTSSRHLVNANYRKQLLVCSAPSTHSRNTQNVPIDGIWITPSLEVSACGFKAFDAVFPGTDQKTAWLELIYNIYIYIYIYIYI
jgi:hypothetical protein